MSLLGIDVGTTGCKAAAFRADGTLIATAYAEYPTQMRRPGWAEFDAVDVWNKVCGVIRDVASYCAADPIEALSTSSLGEACVPVNERREILGPSILNFDARGGEYVKTVMGPDTPEHFYDQVGVSSEPHYGLMKLLWIRDNERELFDSARWFLPWTSFVSFMLGADAAVDYSLAGRMCCFDVGQTDWSKAVLDRAAFDVDKLPPAAPAGQMIGTVSQAAATDLGLPPGVKIVLGCHDQCATAVGCGVIDEGPAACGMGSYCCITPTFRQRPLTSIMLRNGLNTEQHAVPDRYVSFLYNQSGVLLRWFRDTFAGAEAAAAEREGRDVYNELTREMPATPSDVFVLPHFVPTGPPEFVSNSSGVMTGLTLGTTRGEILKGVLEGVIFHLRGCVEALHEAGGSITELRAAGGGSKSDAWLQIAADILQRPFTRVQHAEAGLLGAALLAGVGCGRFASFDEAVATAVKTGATFEPDPQRAADYDERYAHYVKLWPTLREFLCSAPRKT